jgi:hypothetical protein
MPHGSLEDPIAKLQRAVEHYLAIKTAIGGRDHPPVSMRMVSSKDGLRYDFYAEDMPPLPAKLHAPLKDSDLLGVPAFQHVPIESARRLHMGSLWQVGPELVLGVSYVQSP